MPRCLKCNKFLFNPFAERCSDCKELESKRREAEIIKFEKELVQKKEEDRKQTEDLKRKTEEERRKKEEQRCLEVDRQRNQKEEEIKRIIAEITRNLSLNRDGVCRVCLKPHTQEIITLLDSRFIHKSCADTIEKVRQTDFATDEYTKQVFKLYDQWPDYPPDWGKRKRLVRERDVSQCNKCKGFFHNAELHTHHKIPLSKGGTNELSNLLCLCEYCHSDIHHRDLIEQHNQQVTAYARRLEIIQEAIRLKQDITFLYKKPEDTAFERRIVTPYRLANYEHIQNRGNTQCIEGFCHIRGEDRCFAIRRMKGVKLITE